MTATRPPRACHPHQNSACFRCRSARLPLGAHSTRWTTPSSVPTPVPSCRLPHAPPPGVSITSLSPFPIQIVAFPPMLMYRGSGSPCPSTYSLDRSPSSLRNCFTHVFRPSPPGPPPSRPYGCRALLYPPHIMINRHTQQTKKSATDFT